MFRSLKPRIPGLLIAIAVIAVVATSGSAVAAALVTSKQIKNGTIQMKDLSKKTRAKVKDGSGPQGPQGDQGPQGVQGPKGDTGEPGPATGPAGGVLAGNYPNPELATEIDRLTPVAAFVYLGSTGGVNSEAHRAPMTGAPVVTRIGAGEYRVNLPGVDFYTADDVANCTTNNSRLSVGISSSLGGMAIETRNNGDTLTDASRVRCVVYDLAD
jgi:hypothetical protein